MSRYTKPKREKRKRPSRPDKTTLWRVGLRYRDGIYEIVVSKKYIDEQYHTIKIRTISPKAAARKYIRENLTWFIASMDLETTNIMAPHYMDMDHEYLKRVKKRNPAYQIVVQK